MTILLQRGASIITKQRSCALLQRGQSYYKVEQLIHSKVRQSLLHRGDMYYKKVRFITMWGRYYKLWHELIQNGAGNLLQSGSIVIAKWAGYY